jgi:cell wall-associated NlpC family hydrolase
MPSQISRPATARHASCPAVAFVVALLCAAFLGSVLLAAPASAETRGEAIVGAAQAIQSQSYPAESFASAKYIYCFDGGTTGGATAGGQDPDSDGSYSNCNSIGRVGFDCRGLALYAVYQGSGGAISLPTSTAQAQYSDASSYGGAYISLSSLQPGDLVFFGGSSGDVEHVGIVVSGTGSSAEIISAISEKYGIATETVSWFQAAFGWTGAVAVPGVGNTVGGAGREPNGTFIKVAGSAPIYRVIGGAAIHIDTCAPFNGCAGLTEVSSLSEYAAEPENGAYVVIANGPQEGQIDRAVGGLFLGLSTCEGLSGCDEAIGIDAQALTEYNDAHPTIANGTFLRVADGPNTGLIGRVVGGVLLGLNTCEGIAGCDSAVGVPESTYDWYASQHEIIENGTLIRVADGPNAGLIGRVVGGVLLGLSTCEGIEDCSSAIEVDEDAYDWYAAQHQIIANGTFLRVADGPNTGLIGRVVGGVLLGLNTCEGIEGCDTAVNLPESTYDWYASQHSTIENGTFVRIADGTSNGLIGRAAGGVLIGFASCEAIEGCSSAVNIDEDAWNWYASQHQTVENGTFVRVGNGPSEGLVTRAAGGALIGLTTCAALEGCPAAVNVDETGFRLYTAAHPVPANGTLVEGVPSDTYWLFTNGEREPAAAGASAVAIDDGGLAFYPIKAPSSGNPGAGSTGTATTSSTAVSTGSGSTTSSPGKGGVLASHTAKPLTREQKLGKAIRACDKLRRKRKREACIGAARRRYHEPKKTKR